MGKSGLLMVSVAVLAVACTADNLVGSESKALGRAVKRPITDFLETQGTLCVQLNEEGNPECVEDGEDCFLFVEPDPNFLGWTNDTDINNDGVQDVPLRFAGIDYAGLADAYSEGNEPMIRGTIIERPLKDGRAELKIRLHTKGANAWVMGLDLEGDVLDQIANRPTLFGHRPRDVQEGAGQALADTTLRVTLINTAPGAPIPDLLRFVQGGDCVPEGVEQTALQFVARAEGPLTEEFGVPEGTPGRATINQNGIFHTSSQANGRGVGDGFPAEFIKLKVVGN